MEKPIHLINMVNDLSEIMIDNICSIFEVTREDLERYQGSKIKKELHLIWDEPLSKIMPEKPNLKSNLLRGIRTHVVRHRMIEPDGVVTFRHLRIVIESSALWAIHGIGESCIEWTLSEYHKILKERGLK